MDVGRPSANILIRNLTVNSPCCAGVCIGSEMSGGVYNVVVEDCHFVSVGQGLRIKAGIGRGAYVKDVLYRNIKMDDVKEWAIQINDFYGNRNPSCGSRNATVTPKIHSIVYESIEAVATRNGADFEGLSNATIRDVLLSGVVLNARNVTYSCSAVSGKYARCQPEPCSAFTPNSDD